ncbi:MAG: type II toxin-antitoxin system HicB family antitoxin [Deltaproteobacteria bacterium]|nr:type II toxin-antitoxin system HicB family antitoxin [Deltaproteobacteria bacterium]MBW2223792.1 type II toxin-antitoxin system HicB family antitoxin [Deltaproteobacteria bacterium]MBW2402956.1 type II toxin-antitoxin system HicB family antitoxin [Deltaproteobacteria bacterium]MBW2546679.1 type II toxin-antitoxin system HicB family antitoxin [Deltaproteobacteria bacterium]MBW2719735.1 type II toxin-antitoxin system HicB family antitoxin [Deltaproteobacteria bacterium]
MSIAIELEREDDGRWLAEVPALPGVMAYGASKDEALRAVQTLALRVIADRLEQGEPVSEAMLSAFHVAA